MSRFLLAFVLVLPVKRSFFFFLKIKLFHDIYLLNRFKKYAINLNNLIHFSVEIFYEARMFSYKEYFCLICY